MKHEQPNIKSPEHARAAWAERYAIQHGRISRSNIAEAFGVSLATASTDIAYLNREHPGLLDYDPATRAYVAKSKSLKLAVPPWASLLTYGPDANRKAARKGGKA